MHLPVGHTPILSAAIILSSLLFFYAYYYFAHSVFLREYIEKRTQHIQLELKLFFAKKTLGFLLLGVIPGIIYYFLLNPDFEQFGLSFTALKNNLSLIFSLILIISIILFIAQKMNLERNSLQLKLTEWNMLLFLLNSIGWIIYLAGYEFLFRGILLVECNNSFGFWPAIAINVTIYSAIHMVNGKDQAIGALIFGTLACYLTLTKGTILIPFIMHISLSLISDYFSIRLNPRLNFITSKKNNLNKI
ncbi:MAG TPA: CPBP family intramembrane glutamic endopeptidase [Draconibacterium sp.]|nr:CPBP family intramembrane glutamic endopeptidase [Draconibacterium sp.]